MSEPVNFADLGLLPGRKVTFTVEGERVVEDPPIAGGNPTSLGDVWVGETKPDPAAIASFTAAAETLRADFGREPIALTAPPTDEVARILRQIEDAMRPPPYVPGCRCGCMDGKPTR